MDNSVLDVVKSFYALGQTGQAQFLRHLVRQGLLTTTSEADYEFRSERYVGDYRDYTIKVHLLLNGRAEIAMFPVELSVLVKDFESNADY